ncbi:MAG: 50S ribosomal protein L24 [Planctomycetes bacterium]|nr:50S ribosomal protein L24 [Planctomycetota bacterium]
MMKIRTNDVVEIISGDEKGKQGKVLRTIQETHRIVVEGVNRVFRHMRKSAQNPKGQRIQKEAPLDVSNVALFCPTCKQGVRVGHKTTPDGQKVRICRKCGNEFEKVVVRGKRRGA